MNEKLQKYLDEKVMPKNDLNDEGHNAFHVNYVRRRSMKFAIMIGNVNLDMVDTIAVYHDVGHSIDSKNHEKISAKILYEDENLREFFDEDEIIVMMEAIEDHRASDGTIPRSIYGKIVSSADRNTSVNELLKRTYAYRLKHMPDAELDLIIEDSKKHAINKFGVNGYAISKMYFFDDEYENFLREIQELVSDNEEFKRSFIKVNNIDIIKSRIKES